MRLKKIKTLTILSIVWALAVSIVTSSDSATDKIQLRLRLQKGESYNLRMTVNQKISQNIQGQQQDMTQTIGTGYLFNVADVNENEMASVKVTYRSILFRQDGPMGTIEYDSSNPPAAVPPMAMGFAALVGQSFSMIISPEGHVKSIQGVDAMLTRMMKQFDLPDDSMRDSVEKNLREQFGDEALKESMENLMAIYPDKPVGTGDSWTKKVIISKGFPFILDNTWTLKTRKDGVSIIEVSSKISANPKAAPIVMGTMKLSYDISGKQKGTMELQEATGWIRRAESTQEFSGRVKMEDASQMPEGMSWPISVKSVITLVPLEK
jgi:hypothetical protein